MEDKETQVYWDQINEQKAKKRISSVYQKNKKLKEIKKADGFSIIPELMLKFPAHPKGRDIGNSGSATFAVEFQTAGVGLGLEYERRRQLDNQATQLLQPTSFWLAGEILKMFEKNDNIAAVGRGYDEMSNQGRRNIFLLMNFQRREREKPIEKAIESWEKLMKEPIIKSMTMSELKRNDFKKISRLLDNIAESRRKGIFIGPMNFGEDKWEQIQTILNEPI
ncbi:unnamed protein product [Oikopleura dioica]|uniref:Uncharacterized protein n=1 Tax=Oikopleura dioica TaxID=34765 RepID=E4X2E4_OIKDI|nr:unnamed protein product [Oikopleura dioica]